MRADSLAVLGLAILPLACRGKTPAPGSAAASTSARAPLPPLDTSWEHEATHLLAVGDAAPHFEGIGHTGMRVRLEAFLGRPTVVYFYPGDRTPVAQTLARGFRDAWLELLPVCSMVLGISPDDRVRHRDFATAEELPFLLVADESRKIARAFGVPEGGTVTFIIGTDGKITHVFSPVTPDGHAAEVVRALSVK